MAADDDTFQPYINYSRGHDDNLLRLSDSDPLSSGDSRSDTYANIVGGIAFKKSIGQQNLTASASAGRVKFDRFSTLDYHTENLAANWNWHADSHLEGNLGATMNESLTPFTDFHQQLRNIRTQRRSYFDAAWRFHPAFRVRGAASRYRLNYDLPSQRFENLTEDTTELDFDYVARSNSTIGLQLRHLDGKYPNSFTFGPLVINNDYIQNELKATLDWHFSGKSELQFAGGWVQRKHESFSYRDANGTNARLTLDWAPTTKTGLNVGLWREFGSVDNLTSSYTVNRGASLGANWDISYKVRLEGHLNREKRGFAGSPLLTGIEASTREDTLNSSALTLRYALLRNLQLTATASRERLSSNIPEASYRSNTYLLSASYSF